jgi:hypothetical protein
MAFTEDVELPLDDLTRHSTNTCSSRRSTSAHDELDGKASPQKMTKRTTLGGGSDLDDTAEQLRKLSVHNNEEEKSWIHLDSVHSAKGGYTNPYLNNSLNASGDSMDFNDSCASFASFCGGGSEDGENNNGSKSSLNGGNGSSSERDLALATAAFCRLETESIIVPKRRPPAVMMRAPSVRLNKGPSFRQTSLQLIEEKDDL